MKCEACGSSWNAAEELVGKITKCLFCGRELYERTIEGQMKLLVKQHGIGILSDAAKINGILADMFPQNSLGVLYEEIMDVTNAMKWYKKAADNGNANASASYLRLRNRYPIASEDE